MDNNKQVIGIRCHNFGESEQFLYSTLLEYFSKDTIFFIVDEIEKPKIFPDWVNKVSLDSAFIASNHLYDKPKVAWQCGDYFYYVFKEKIEADFYWLIEPDVLINLRSVAGFFEFFKDNKTDALVTEFRVAKEHWVWYESAKAIFDPPYACFFPLTRLSKRSVEIMQAKRQQISVKHLGQQHKAQFPNDEALLANALMEAGIKPVDFSSYFPEQFESFSIAPFKNKNLSIQYCEEQIIHPVKDVDFYEQAIKVHIDALFDKGMKHIIKNSVLDKNEYRNLMLYARNYFEGKLFESFEAKNRVNFSLQKLVFSFRANAKANFKRVVRADNELRFFMGQGVIVAFLFEPSSITAVKRAYTKGTANYTESLVQTYSGDLLGCFDTLQAELEQLLQQYEIKKDALKQ